MRSTLSFLLLAATLAGCGAKTPAPDTTAAAQAAAPAEAGGNVLTGPVIEQVAVPPYVYLHIRTAQGEIWAAVPEATIENGTVVTLANSMLMTDFESKSLNRTFDKIYFGTLAPAGGAMAATAGNPHAGVPQSAAAVDVGKVEKAAGADAYTVAEIWTRKTSLEGKTVTVRGVVVKVNDGVMGKNWIHLQDGSGDGAQGTNDITVTTLDRAAKGATVTIRGTVRTNRDFGAGYTYAVMIEDAKVVP